MRFVITEAPFGLLHSSRGINFITATFHIVITSHVTLHNDK